MITHEYRSVDFSEVVREEERLRQVFGGFCIRRGYSMQFDYAVDANNRFVLTCEFIKLWEKSLTLS